MRLNSNDRITLRGDDVIINHNNNDIKVAKNESFIKEKLGWFEGILNFFKSFVSQDYWKQKTVTVDIKGHTHQEIRYIFEQNIHVSQEPRSLPSQDLNATSKTPLLTNFTKSGTSSAVSSRSVSPDLTSVNYNYETPSAASSRSISPVEMHKKSPANAFSKELRESYLEIKTIYEGWISNLQTPGAKISTLTPSNLQIQPAGGKVIHKKIPQTVATGSYNLLFPTFELINKFCGPSFQLNFTTPDVDFKKYENSCGEAIKILNSQEPSEDRDLTIALLKRSLFLAKKFEVLSQRRPESGPWLSDTDSNLFKPSRWDL